ncbi:sigma-70 family RNA polymerase sigma factor [Phenylobacterium sp.]|uniref:sigma-70 family RNA polymerase sigma factor n=1 Tax=Phenylobacterium sp. TaxID=1871053 RepID=UPI003BAA3BAF
MSPSDASAIFEAERPRLVRIAYRMLGSMAEAEDVVQDAWLRWRSVDSGEVRHPAAFLARTVTRLCLDTMKSARARRETYVGSWLPEPIFEAEEEVLPLDELTLTLMLALERLSPLERAAFLLHDVFDVPMEEVAVTLQRDAGAVRQLAVRARKHLQAARPRYPVERTEGERIAQAFYAASSQGDVAGLRDILADTVVLQSDGGGKAYAFLRPIIGLEKVVRMFAGIRKKFAATPSVFVEWAWIDGLPGFISYERDGALQTTALEIEDGRVAAVYIIRNPDKLSRAARHGGPRAGEARH